VLGEGNVSEEIREQAREMAARIYVAMNCRGLVCVSFVVEKTTGELFFSDLDPFPEFSAESFCIQLFDASGFSGPELLSELLKRAMEEKE
jgi:D-alanine-D-alanine ligase